LPGAGPYELGASIRFNLDEYLEVGDLTGHIGASDIHGHLQWDMSASPPAIKVRLDSQQMDVGDMGMGDTLTCNADQGHTEYWAQPLDIGILGTIDLDVEAQIQWLNGLAKPAQDIVLTAYADRQRLRLAAVKATVDGRQIAASAALMWGKRLTALGKLWRQNRAADAAC
jgi:hypothetical protein